MTVDWVCLDVGETLVDETRVWATWAAELGFTPLTFGAVLGATIVRGDDPRSVFDALGVPDWRSHDAAVDAAYVGFRESDLYPDALAGTPLAVREQAPMLLTAPASLDSRTEAELRRVLSPGRIVYILGGTAAISPAVARRVREDGYRVVRLGGPNRFATAVAIAGNLGPPNDILLATGDDPADALSAGPAAAELGGVVVLTDGRRLPAETAAYLASEGAVAQFALGGPSAAADPSATPLVGADRYATSVVVAERFFTRPTIVGFANGFAFADALSGSVDIGAKGGPLILVAPDVLPGSVTTYLYSIAPTVTTGIVYGGTSVIPASEIDRIAEVLNGR